MAPEKEEKMTFNIRRVSAPLFPRKEQLPCDGAFVISKEECSDYPEHYEIEYGIVIDTLDDLLRLSRSVGHPLVVNAEEMSLEIYDDFRE